MELRKIKRVAELFGFAVHGASDGLAYAAGYAFGTVLGSTIDIIDAALDVWGDDDE